MPVSPEMRLRLNLMQAFEDAAEWRIARMAKACENCVGSRQCDDHANDADLVERYRKRHDAILRAGPGELEAALML